MSRTLTNQHFTARDGCADGHPTLRNLDKKRVYGVRCLFRPQGNVDRSVSVGVHNQAAFGALEYWAASAASASAPTAGLASVLRHDCVHADAVLPSHALQRLPKLGVRHPLDFAVALPAQFGAVKVPEMLDGDGCVMLQRQCNYLVRHLIAPRRVEATLVSLDIPQGSPSPACAFRTEDAAPNSQIALDVEQIAAEIQLPNRAAASDDADGRQTVDADVDSDDCVSLRADVEVLSEDDVDAQPTPAGAVERHLRKCVACIHEHAEAAESAVRPDGQTDSGSDGNWVAALGATDASAARNIESNRLVIEGGDVVVSANYPSVLAGVDRQLRRQTARADSGIARGLKTVLGLEFGCAQRRQISVARTQVGAEERIDATLLRVRQVADVQPNSLNNRLHTIAIRANDYKYLTMEQTNKNKEGWLSSLPEAGGASSQHKR